MSALDKSGGSGGCEGGNMAKRIMGVFLVSQSVLNVIHQGPKISDVLKHGGEDISASLGDCLS